MVLFTYKPINTAIETEVEVRYSSFLLCSTACTLLKNRWVQSMHKLKIRNPGYFVFRKHFNVIMLELSIYVHGAEVFAKMK